MTRSDLKEKIKNIVKQVYSKPTTSSHVDLDNPSVVTLDNARFPVLIKFPTLKDSIVKLLTQQYELFIKDIEWVAPRPTTFRIILANDQPFYLIYTDRTWVGKVEGKKYYLLNLSEEENCIEAIARILAYGAQAMPKKEESSDSSVTKPSSAKTSTSGSSFSPETPSPEAEAPAPEAPAPEEEAPAEENPTA